MGITPDDIDEEEIQELADNVGELYHIKSIYIISQKVI